MGYRIRTMNMAALIKTLNVRLSLLFIIYMLAIF